MSADGFSIRMEWQGETVFLRLSGQLDIAVADEVEASVHAVAGSSARHVVIDLADLDFMDSSGLRVLLRTRHALGRNGRTLVLADPAPTVQRVLDVTGAGGLLPVEASAQRTAA